MGEFTCRKIRAEGPTSRITNPKGRKRVVGLGWACLFGQSSLNQPRYFAHVGFSSQLGFHCAHDFTHVLRASCAHCLNNGLNFGHNFCFGQLRGKIRCQNSSFGFFNLGRLWPTTLLKLDGGFVSLLDLLFDDGENRPIVEFDAFVDLFLFDCR